MIDAQAAMKWDEEKFGLEYDLDIFNVVAVNDFNMGAMENKGLNVFNTAFVLAKPGKKEGWGGVGGGGEGCSFVASLSHLTLDCASLSSRSTGSMYGRVGHHRMSTEHAVPKYMDHVY